jgi:hypothetical protein
MENILKKLNKLLIATAATGAPSEVFFFTQKDFPLLKTIIQSYQLTEF